VGDLAAIAAAAKLAWTEPREPLAAMFGVAGGRALCVNCVSNRGRRDRTRGGRDYSVALRGTGQRYMVAEGSRRIGVIAAILWSKGPSNLGSASDRSSLVSGSCLRRPRFAPAARCAFAARETRGARRARARGEARSPL